ncbi:MAG: dihydroneopterin triphosphate diphosphatase [Pseudomonadota bacterium]|nr:dihydroneopterin triphosphate diphosphatase [Pseudomonadota bacterium]
MAGRGSGALEKKRSYKRPESVLVVVFTAQGDFLLLRRTEPSTFWQSVTGSLKRGETPRRAALRELWEETGISDRAALLDLGQVVRFPILPAWRKRYAPGVHYNREHWFALPLKHRRLIRRNPKEHSEHRWLPAHRAAATATSWTNRDAILALSAVVWKA